MSSAKSNTRGPLGRLLAKSFRFQVTAWNTFTILIFGAVTLFGLRYGLTLMLLQEEDRLLAEDAAEVNLVVRQFAPDWDQVTAELERKAESHEPRKWFGVVRDRNGRAVARSSAELPVKLPADKSPYRSAASVDNFRLSFRRADDGNFPGLTIVVGATTDEITDDVGRLTRLILFACAGLLVLAPLGGFLLAGRVIRPLANMIAQTNRLRPSNIGERLPIRRTGDELDQLAVTINALLDRIANYLARHRDLTANAAHELRSPLAAILTSAEVALAQDRTPAEYQELLGSIIEECTRLGTLVQQLLLLAESDAGRLEPKREPIALDILCRQAVEMFRGVAESKGIKLTCDALAPVRTTGDAGILRQVICNLIDNALKFTAEGSVTVSVPPPGEKTAAIVVSDTGVGIPPENLPYVFDRFYRGDHARTRLATGGSGLGLSICKALIGACGGEIELESVQGRGTTVKVILPAVPTKAPPPGKHLTEL